MAITPERIREIKERLRQKQAEQRRRDFLAKIDFLYHFTDTRNLASIREHGGTYSLEQIERRGIEIPVFGGDDTSQDSDRSSGMDGYVHLCFRPHHPMEFRAK